MCAGPLSLPTTGRSVACLAPGGFRPAAREPGQSLVELAIVLPAVVVGLLLVIGLGILGQAKAGVQAVADEAARAGALTSTPERRRGGRH